MKQDKMVEMIDALQILVIKKAESFDEKTSPEEICALAELVRVIILSKRKTEIDVI